jgi:outer membrane protein
MHKRILYGMAAMVLLLATLVAAAQPATGRITLKQAVETALVNNLAVKQSELQMQTAEVNLNQAKGNMLPNIGGNINHFANQGRNIDPSSNGYINEKNTTANYSFSGNVTLFNGFRLLNALKQNQYAAEASKMEWLQSKDKLMVDVMLAFLTVLNNQDLLEQATHQLDVSKIQVDRLDLMNKDGAIKPSDLSDLKGQYASDQISLINAKNTLETSKVTLAQLMNVAYDKNLAAEQLSADQFDLNYNATPDSIYESAVHQLAIIKGFELRNKSYEKAVSAAKGNLYPSLGMGAGYATNYSSTAKDQLNNKISYSTQLKNNYGTYIGAGINIPILNNFRYRNQVRLAKIDWKNAQFIEQTSKTQLRQNIERDYFNMTASIERYKTLTEQVSAYTESFRAAEIRFNQGVGTSVDYIIAKNNLDRAKSNLIIARYYYLLRIKILDYYQSKPLW